MEEEKELEEYQVTDGILGKIEELGSENKHSRSKAHYEADAIDRS